MQCTESPPDSDNCDSDTDLIIYIILSTFIFAMSDGSQPQSVQDVEIENQEPEDLIRQGYSVQASGGRTYVVPTTLQTEDLQLAKMLMPDISVALTMPAGVTLVFSWNMNIF
jgi:hypothetical protein